MERDISQHNQEIRKVWSAFQKGSPIRVPVLWRIPAHAMAWAIYRPGLNQWNCSLYDLVEDFDLSWKVQLFMQSWLRENVHPLCDLEVGPPDEWLGPYYPHQCLEAAWLGAPMDKACEEPRALPILAEQPQFLLERGLPHPLKEGVMTQVVAFYEYCHERRKQEQYLGRPVGVPRISMCTAGPFTLFCSLRGAQQVCLDVYADADYFHQMMGFLTDAILLRIQALASFVGISLPVSGWVNTIKTGDDSLCMLSPRIGDDSIALLSPQCYREHVLPYHRRLFQGVHGDGLRGIHLCGAVRHLIPIIAKELDVRLFETGFPVDLGELREKVGSGVRFRGNLHGETLRSGSAAVIQDAVVQLLRSGVMDGGQFILTDGGHPVDVPLENLDLAYQEVRRTGVYL